MGAVLVYNRKRDTGLMRPLLPLCDLTFGTAAQLTSEEEENYDGLAAQRATDKKEKKNARNRERAKRNRMNRRFQAQIDHGFNEKREIFNGSIGGMDNKTTIAREDLEINEVTQLSEMKEITGYGARGNGMPRFRGAIVAEKHGRHTRYIGVPEGRFMRHDLCWAKHGSHATAKWLLAFRKTGVVDNRVIIAWESKPNEWAVVHESRTLDFSLLQQNPRHTAWPKRFEPGASDMLRKTTPVLSKGAWNPMSSTKVMISKATKNTTPFASSCCWAINVGEKLRWRREIMKQRFTSSKTCMRRRS